MATHKVQVSMDGLRRGLTDDATELKEAIVSIFEYIPDDEKQELIERFDTLACGLNSFNCMHVTGDETFTNMEDLEVNHIGNYG